MHRYKKRALAIQETMTTKTVVLPTKVKMKRRDKFKKCMKRMRTIFCGSAMKLYSKPVLTSTDCFYMLLNIHLNLRFICMLIDLSFEWSTIFVFVVFSLTYTIMCTCLAFIYTFLGRYGARSFINLWDMVPLFQGISACIIIIEFLKMIEMNHMITSGLLTFYNQFYYINNAIRLTKLNNSKVLTKCTRPVEFIPGYGVPFSRSLLFNLIGGNTDFLSDSYMALFFTRITVIIPLWVFIIVLRLITVNRFRRFVTRSVPIMTCLVLSGIYIIANVLRNPDEEKSDGDEMGAPEESLWVNHIYSLHSYLQVFAFAVREYLPSHWVTIGYLNPNPMMRTHIWGLSLLIILFSWLIGSSLEAYMKAFRDYTATHVPVECMNFFGLQYIFIVIPYAFRYYFGNYAYILIIVYMVVMCLNGIVYIYTNCDLLLMAFNARSQRMYRFRYMLSIFLGVILCAGTVFSSPPSSHYDLFYFNVIVNYFVTMAIFLLTMMCLAIYGLERMNADHNFLCGVIFTHNASTKILFILSTAITVLFAISNYFYTHRTKHIAIVHLCMIGGILAPILLGMVKTILCQKAYHHVLLRPLTTWGRPDELMRSSRRRKNRRQMFIYRTRRVCEHNCMLMHSQLHAEIEDELALRELLLDEFVDSDEETSMFEDTDKDDTFEQFNANMDDDEDIGSSFTRIIHID